MARRRAPFPGSAVVLPRLRASERENVIASADCGFSSRASYAPEVHPTVVWEKFRALSEGAAIATSRLWS